MLNQINENLKSTLADLREQISSKPGKVGEINIVGEANGLPVEISGGYVIV